MHHWSAARTIRRRIARAIEPLLRALEGRNRAELRGWLNAGPIGPAIRARIARPRLLHTGQVYSRSGASTGRLVSVIIPVKNGAADLRELLPRIVDQRSTDDLEIIAVDSGSEDDTVEVLRRFQATIVAIDPLSFNHGLTRNLAASYARGRVLVFVTQRALPADEWWLPNLVKPFDADLLIAGVSSRRLPRPDADPLTRRDTLEYLLSSSGERSVRAITDAAVYSKLDPVQVRTLIDFHTVSGAIRANVLARIPFRKVSPSGEDILWAREVLEAGYKIQHEPSSVVLHSHAFSFGDLLRRSFDNGVVLRKLLGMRLDESGIVPTILAMARDDWRYLEHECQLDATELEHWKRASVLRRTAQIVGLWLGENEDRLPHDLSSWLSFTERFRAGLLPEEVRPTLERTTTPPGLTSRPEREP